MQYFRKPNLKDRGWRATLCPRRAPRPCERWHKNRYYWATRLTIRHLSVVKIFSPPCPPFACRAHSKLQNNPFFRLFTFFYLFSNAHYSKQNWSFLIQRPPKSSFSGLVFFSKIMGAPYLATPIIPIYFK